MKNTIKNPRIIITITIVIITFGIVFQNNGAKQGQLHGAQQVTHETSSNETPPTQAPVTVTKEELEVEEVATQAPLDKSQLITSLTAAENPFTDTDHNSLEGRAAASFFQLGIIQGFENNEFRGSLLIDRTDAERILMLISNNDNKDEKTLDTTTSGGLLQRDAFLAILSRILNAPTGLPHGFQDVVNYPAAWFWRYAGIAFQYNLFPGEKTLNPAQNVTRAEFVIALYQYINNK